MINWKAIIIGFILAIIFTSILGGITETFGSYISILIASIIVGYMVNKDIINGAIHGGLIAIIGSIVAIIIMLWVSGGSDIAFRVLGFTAVFAIIVDVILGVIGGAIGSVITKKRI